MRHIILLSCSVSLILVFIDIQDKFFDHYDNSNKSIITPSAIYSARLPQLSLKEQNDIENFINENTVETKSEVTSPVQGMADSEQMVQQGELDALFSGNMSYELVAVITPTQNGKVHPVAIIKSNNFLTNETEFIRMVDGELLGFYKMSIPNLNRVNLINSKNGMLVELVMYRKK